MPDALAPATREGLWRRWFATVTLGEFVGFLAPATAGALTAGARPGIVAAAVLCAGAVEGAVLGSFQAAVLRSVLSGLRRWEWVRVTVLGAVVAWTIGLIPILFGEQVGRWPGWARIPFAVAAGVAVVFSIGVAQWIVLRHFTGRARLWLWANVVGWIAGLAAFGVVTTPLWQPGQAAVLVTAIGVLGGLVMAAVMAAVTGAFLVRILARSHPPER
ncbi:hypothetical protein BJY24_005655 [Nocardia transvalensis]|uniref:Uncharacterized protein n=1 Tax=Nocardia transvalensis TaxID=37333 RepID=A0A7W9UKN6_9NOCA|nr:hypothetical protein [Nocardia transvalensis]MBB5916743.1 hypothetical protein [Nocardia transvalensis]